MGLFAFSSCPVKVTLTSDLITKYLMYSARQTGKYVLALNVGGFYASP